MSPETREPVPNLLFPNERRKRTGRFLPACAVFLLGMSLAVPAFGQVKDSGRLAAEYQKAAAAESAAGRFDSALSFLNRGLELAPDDADLRYERAANRFYHGGSIRLALADVAKANAGASWRRHNRADGAELECAVLAGMHRYREAADAADRAFPGAALDKYPRLLAAKADALFALGQRAQAGALVDAGFARHPDNFAIMRVAVKNQLIPPAASFLWFNRFKAADEDYLQALFWYLFRLEPGQEGVDRSREYIELGGRDPLAYVAGLRSARALAGFSEADEKRWVDGLLASSAPYDLDAVKSMLDLVQFDADRAALRASLTAPRLVAYRDHDRDGRYEERLVFAAGVVQSWRVEDNQDGLADLEIRFRAGQPAYAFQQNDAETIRIDYGAYPEVETAWVYGSGRIVELVMPHRLENIRVIDLPAESDGPLAILAGLDASRQCRLLSAERLQAAAWLVDEYRPDGQGNIGLGKQTRQVGGRPVSMRLDGNLDGRFDRYYLYENGSPAIGFRDVQDDGNFSVVEFFDKGKPSLYQFVSKDDGTSFSLKAPEGVQRWDLNHDSRLDRRELVAGNLWLSREFSPSEESLFEPSALKRRYGEAWNDPLLRGFEP